MLTCVAIPYQAYQLSGSSLVVGLLSVAELGPLLLTAFIGGALADAFDRRRLVQIAEASLAVCAGALAANALLPSPQLAVLFVVGALMAGLDGLQRPPLDALIPRLVERHELTAASALDSFRGNIGMLAGPAVGGVLIATAGLPLTYGIDVLTFAVSLGALTLMRAVPPPAGAEPPSLRRIADGVRYAWSRPELMGTYGVDMIAMFFGMPMALFPALAEDLGGAGALGLLYAAPSLGSPPQRAAGRTTCTATGWPSSGPRPAGERRSSLSASRPTWASPSRPSRSRGRRT
jgi:MFS family permease